MTVENVLLLCGIGDIMTGLVFVMIVIDSILTTEVYGTWFVQISGLCIDL